MQLGYFDGPNPTTLLDGDGQTQLPQNPHDCITDIGIMLLLVVYKIYRVGPPVYSERRDKTPQKQRGGTLCDITKGLAKQNLVFEQILSEKEQAKAETKKGLFSLPGIFLHTNQ